MTDTPSIEPTLSRVLARKSGVRLALLFGSVARGTAGPGSDVDIAVDAPGVDLLALGAELGEELGREVDVVGLADVTTPLLERLLREAKVVHEGRGSAAAMWRSRVLTQLETDRPWYGRRRDAWLAWVAEKGLRHG